MTCSSAGHGNLAIFDAAPTTWTKYEYNHTANSTSSTLMFGFTNNPSGLRYWFLAYVSVVRLTAPNTELLLNPNFDNSTTDLIDWTQYCTDTCTNGAVGGGQVTNSTECISTECYVDHCHGAGAIDFLSQTFSTMNGHIYTISFWIKNYGSGSNASTYAYVDIY